MLPSTHDWPAAHLCTATRLIQTSASTHLANGKSRLPFLPGSDLAPRPPGCIPQTFKNKSPYNMPPPQEALQDPLTPPTSHSSSAILPHPTFTPPSQTSFFVHFQPARITPLGLCNCSFSLQFLYSLRPQLLRSPFRCVFPGKPP